MLTDIYYYNNYRNNLLNSRGSSKQRLKQENNTKNMTKVESIDDKSIRLNKAYNPKVISYISDIASSVNELKSSTNSIRKEFREVSKSFKYKGEEETFNIIKDEIDDFLEAYNTSTDIFNKDLKDSSYLKDYYNEIQGSIKKNIKPLNNLSIYLDKDNKLHFNEEEFDNSSLESKVASIKNLSKLFKKVNNETNEVLKVPLSNHLDFKSFSYYFNYKINSTYNDTFKLVETGTLIDIAI